MTELLQAPGKLEGNFGTRNLQDNISDLKAQVAANTKGANLMHELVRLVISFFFVFVVVISCASNWSKFCSELLICFVLSISLRR